MSIVLAERRCRGIGVDDWMTFRLIGRRGPGHGVDGSALEESSEGTYSVCVDSASPDGVEEFGSTVAASSMNM